MKKILLLDDNLDIVQVVEEVLAYDHYDVKSITKSSDLLAIAENYKPDLFIFDYRLADGNGGELCRDIKAHPQFYHIPVIIFTAYKQPGLNLKVYGCDEVINKPFDLEEMLEKIKSLLTS